jgi:phenylalanyl-tRNA synthetase beta chain
VKIATDVLERYVTLPEGVRSAPRGLRDLLDDLGIEVKRQEGEVYTLELLANRGDHHCYEGVAREVAARFALPLSLPASVDLDVGDSPVPVRIESDLCLVYTATLLEGGSGDLSEASLRPLRAAGMDTVSAPVDATNLANLELGQPTHAFDADRIEGGITVRVSRPGDRVWPLFTAEPREMPPGHLVIADDRKILAIAGVIGCEESKTTEGTRRILLESAAFDPVAVRKASRALDIHTDSTARFERGSDPSRPLIGAGRVVALLEREAGWQRVGKTGVAGSWTDPERTIWFELSDANRFLGLHLSIERVADILSRLGFHLAIGGDGRIGARVPPVRLWDVEYPADLFEELAKITGYNEAPAALPPVDCGSLPTAPEERRTRVDDVLVGAGFYEVVTDGFHGRQLREKLGISQGHPLWQHVETTNALDRGYALLKNSALAQAVEAVAENLRVRSLEVKLFEWTRTFHVRAEGGPTERRLLWAIASGSERPRTWAERPRPADVWFVRGVVEELAIELGIPLVVGPADPEAPLASLLHPNRQLAVRLDGRVVGVIGEVHPTVLAGFKIKAGRPVYLEIDAAALLETVGRRPEYREPANWHPVERNLAFTLPHEFEAGRVAEALRAAGPPWLERVEMVDVFAHEGSGGERTVTYALFYDNQDNARTVDEVNQATEALVRSVTAELREVRLR